MGKKIEYEGSMRGLSNMSEEFRALSVMKYLSAVACVLVESSLILAVIRLNCPR